MDSRAAASRAGEARRGGGGEVEAAGGGGGGGGRDEGDRAPRPHGEGGDRVGAEAVARDAAGGGEEDGEEDGGAAAEGREDRDPHEAERRDAPRRRGPERDLDDVIGVEGQHDGGRAIGGQRPAVVGDAGDASDPVANGADEKADASRHGVPQVHGHRLEEEEAQARDREEEVNHPGQKNGRHALLVRQDPDESPVGSHASCVGKVPV